ncbi:MAG: hypothetical protein M3R50_03140 [Bacteroidota bacterium]|nr:hypothetical protein [Bacteroidota bacterium]
MLNKPNDLTASYSRRHFLVRTAFASALLISLRKNLFGFPRQNDQSPWRGWIDYARWCPTVHNLQPHKIKIISATEAELYYDPARLLPVEDPESIFVTVALGVFIEHLSIAASPLGKKVIIKEIAAPVKLHQTQNTLFAKLKVVAAEEKEPFNIDLIKKRRTSRLHYSGHPLQEEIIEKVKSEAAKFHHELFYSSKKEFVDKIIQINQETLFEDISSDADRSELDHLFRYSERQAREYKDGLWARCMCVPGAMLKSVFRHPENWMGVKKKLLAAYYKDSFKGTATVCWFGGAFNNTGDWLNAGQMLARSWLLLTQNNAFIHPFGSLITNVNAYKKINETFTQPSEGKKIWMIFRAGYSKEPARSFRLSTDEIVIT